MNNLHRRATFPNADLQHPIDFEVEIGDRDFSESANASGYLASGVYMAASGNSVGITSTAGTTSTTGRSLRSLQLPASLRERLQQQVVTSRKFSAAAGEPLGDKENTMGPPLSIPSRTKGLLRKSRSTNTLRLPKREEGTKPGYCESCRLKFEDFKGHINGRRHRKFAMDDANFVQLDYVLSRVKRRTLAEVSAERMPGNEDHERDDDETTKRHEGQVDPGDDVQWDDWVDTNGM